MDENIQSESEKEFKVRTQDDGKKNSPGVEGTSPQPSDNEVLLESQQELIAVTYLPLDQLKDFTGHPFKLYEGKRLDDFVDDIKKRGVQTPIHVRPIDGGYEILEGHNRVHASRIAGKSPIPVIIFENLSDDDAQIKVVNSNLHQRSFSEMLPSELGNSLNMLNEAMKRKTGPKDGSQIDNQPKTMHLLGEQHNMSQANIARYIRFAYLIEKLQDRLDRKEIGLGVGGHLSHLKVKEQNTIDKIIGQLLKKNVKIDAKQAEALRKASQKKKDGELNEGDIREIIDNKQKDISNATPIKFDKDFLSQLSDFFEEEQSQEEIQDTITKALKLYRSQQKKE